MAYTTIDKPTDYFNTVLYTGNGSTGHAITGVGFQPDLVWLKCRPQARNHRWIDIIRGVGKHLESDNTDAEESPADGLTAFGSDGFTVGNTGGYNNSSENFVAWNWLASNTTASNSDGSITSTVSANQTAGFSIVSYTGTSSTATVGHGLAVTPSMIIVKNRSATQNWIVYHQAIGNTGALYLNATNATDTASGWFNNTSPTSSVFTVGTYDAINGSSHNLIAYCFAEKKGYSKFGSYTGNGSSNGSYIHLGYKPSFVMVRDPNNAENWLMYDNKRPGFNLTNNHLMANTTDVEVASTANTMDLLSGGFKIRSTNNGLNRSGGTFLYMAFAESPFVSSSGIPTTAR